MNAEMFETFTNCLGQLSGKPMKRILVVALLCCASFNPVYASPIYTGIQVDDMATGILLGYQIDKMYAVELHYAEAYSSITHAGITVDTKSASTGISGVARFHMKLRNVLPYDLLIKVGYEHVDITEDYSIPSSVTLTLPYSDTKTSNKNQLILGGGAEYNFSKNVAGRIGLELKDTYRSFNVAVMYRF